MNNSSSEKKEYQTPFIKEIVKYFRDFLETDFHKRRIPKRQIRFHDQSNLLVGLNLSKYPSLYKAMAKVIADGFVNDLPIIKGKHTSTIPDELIELVKLQVDKVVDKKKIEEVRSSTIDVINQSSTVYKKELDKAIENMVEEFSKLIKKHIVMPFITSIEKPLDNLEIGDENNMYMMETELTESISTQAISNITEILKNTIAGNKVNLEKEVKSSFDLAGIRDIVVTFFEDFKVKDAYSDLLELDRNRNILDKQDFYFYFHDISFEKVRYPIFYIPFAIERNNGDFKILFDSQVYINKKALEYIVERYNSDTGKRAKLRTISDRIIYLAQNERPLVETMQAILDEIVEFFGLDNQSDATSTEQLVSKGLFSRITNSYYINLFDKSDEALLNDYEDILEAIELDPDGKIAQEFCGLIEEFVEKDPKSIVKEIEDDWNDCSVPEKLVMKSPIPLNSEQIKILRALDNEDSKYLIVEGPPGTGKSHTITAAVFNHILENKSVLVLSDKKEALDVVEDKINDTIMKVRIDDKFQNPILRLGRIGNKFNKILSTSVVNEIMKNYLVVSKKFPDIGTVISESINSLKNSLNSEISSYEKVKIEELIKFFTLSVNISKLPSLISRTDLKNEKFFQDVDHFRSACKNLRENIDSTKADVKLNFQITEELLNDLTLIINSLSELLKLLNEKNILDYFEKADSVKADKNTVDELIDFYHKTLEYISSEADVDEIKMTNLLSEIEKLCIIQEAVQKTKAVYGTKTKYLNYFSKEDLNAEKAAKLRQFLEKYKALHKPLVGFLFNKKNVEIVDLDFRKEFPFSDIDFLSKHIGQLEDIVEICNYSLSFNKEKDFTDFLKLVTKALTQEKYGEFVAGIGDYKDAYADKLASVLNGEANLTIEELKEISFSKGIQNIFMLVFLTMEKNSLVFDGHVISEQFSSLMKTPSIDKAKKTLESVKNIHSVLVEIKSASDDIDFIKSFEEFYPATSELIKLDLSSGSYKSFTDNILLNLNDYEYSDLIEYYKLLINLDASFEGITNTDYVGYKDEIEKLATAQMTYLMDGRLVDFWLNSKASAQTIKELVRSKQKFPKEEFYKLKEAFPCILAGIRDYAEYVPLAPNLFDLVIIDEASQVSIAQALPALIRAKKVLILGDRKQFGNVKSYQAKLEINNSYLNRIKDIFEKEFSGQVAKIKRAEKFNIKTSVLDFFEYITNFNIQLMKYFRGYKEIISYSNRYFYQNSLQVMKIRGKDISDVLEFSFIDHDGQAELRPNTNSLEIDYIISELLKIKESGQNLSVGIITPHTNQQKYILERISAIPEKNFLFDDLKLKIMTFDTCQGEERDVIFYSMVANPAEDKLFGVFPKSLEGNVDDDEEGNIRKQRLNVGFSRAKEKMHFVLSKSLDLYSGAIGEALRNYWSVIEDAKKEATPDSVDPKSPMEEKILNYFYQTDFWKDNKDTIEFHPQFELGKYLKQLDPTYSHANYKVDFLLLYTDTDSCHKIIIEYDGFEEHFTDLEVVDKYNYSHYYNADDLYRQKVLESYGYKFLRINRFNLGVNPVTTLDSRLFELVKKNFKTALLMG